MGGDVSVDSEMTVMSSSISRPGCHFSILPFDFFYLTSFFFNSQTYIIKSTGITILPDTSIKEVRDVVYPKASSPIRTTLLGTQMSHLISLPRYNFFFF